MPIHGMFSQAGPFFIPLSKTQNFTATQVAKRERMWIPEKRKYNFHKTSMHFLDIAKLEPKILLISIYKICRKNEFHRNG